MSGDIRLPAGTVALLFSDVEGSTALVRMLGDGYTELQDEHDRILRSAFEAYEGVVVDTQGDSFFVAFTRVRDAAAAAVDIQRALAEGVWPSGVTVRVRIGLHAGEPTRSAERYVGLGVHRAARICAAAHGGQVLLSHAAAALLVDHELAGARVQDLGSFSLKDFESPEHLHQLVVDGLHPTFTAPRTSEPPAGPPGPALELRMLGPLEVVVDGRVVALSGRNQRAVLAVLVLHVNHPVSTERIVDDLWGEEAPRTAATSVQNAISQLRKLLGPDRLVTKPAGYVLVAADDELDLGRFERLLAQSRWSSRSSECAS